MTKIIDAHHHLWNYNISDYGWIDDSMKILKRDYLPADLRPLIKKEGIEGTVVVQARQRIEETEFLLRLAESHDFIKGVVGWVDLRSDNIEIQLKKFSVHPKFVGVRHVIHDEPEDNFMLQTDFLKGLEVLQEYDLSYDLLLFPKHLSNAVRLVQYFPKMRFVLDHIAKPFIKSGELANWEEHIFALAEQPNVYCKISGMLTEADHLHWEYEDFVPYLDVVTRAFGSNRLMLGSDWPVCRLAGEYDEVFSILRKYFANISNAEKENIFRKNCIEFYKLQLN